MSLIREFADIGHFVEFLENALIPEFELHMIEGLRKSAELVEKSARKEIGHLQPAVGPFPAWNELAQRTIEDKSRLGFGPPEYDPLYRTGKMKDSLSHELRSDEAVVGFKDPKAVYHEFGTSRMAPRPVLGPALFKNLPKILHLLGEACIQGFVGDTAIHSSISGYSYELK